MSDMTAGATRRGVAILVIAMALGLTVSPNAAAENEELTEDAVPAADAIRLVLDRRADEIRAADSASDRWLDVKDRSWSARRPVFPGYLDTTHTFVVTYAIDGVPMARWIVDTRAGSVVPEPLPKR